MDDKTCVKYLGVGIIMYGGKIQEETDHLYLDIPYEELNNTIYDSSKFKR
jgi:hypothetical protein